MTRLSHLIVVVLGWLSAAASSVHAIECPALQNACGSDVCCAVHDICCSAGRGACCPVSTPYCCGDGTCAVTPTACGSESEPLCPEYQISCGGLCIEAGSDCCNDDGDYCPPTQICTEDACTVAGQIRARIRKGDPHAAGGGYLMPTADPLGPRRTCGVVAAVANETPSAWLLIWLALIVWRCARVASLARRRSSHVTP